MTIPTKSKTINNITITYPSGYKSIQNYVDVLFHNLESLHNNPKYNNPTLLQKYITNIKLIRSAGLDYSTPSEIPAKINNLIK